MISMATAPTVNVPITLRVSRQTQQKLAERAAAAGTDIDLFVSALVERAAQEPLTLEQISGPIYQRFLESGMTDDQLAAALEQEKHEARDSRRARRAS